MPNKPKVSVVICAYNAAHCISGILTSLKHQTFKDFEVVVVNDGSTDNTPKIAETADARVINAPHQGLSATRNVGINSAYADIVAIIDADCIATENWIEEIVKIIDGENESVVTGNTKIPNSTFLGNCISGLGYPGGGHLGFDKMWHVDKDGYTDHLAGGNCAFIKTKIQALGAFNPKLTITGDDVYLSGKILESELKIKYNPNMIMFHEPRKDIKSFLRWHYARGKGSYFFRKHVTGFGKFYKLRLWSAKNMVMQYKTKPHMLIVMVPLLIASFIAQKTGYFVQKWSHNEE